MKYYILFFLLTTITINAQWTPVENVPKARPIPAIYFDGTTAIACADSFVFISDDYGKSWIQSGRVNEADFINTAVKYNNRIFVGTEIYGVFESTDGGKTWHSFNSGFFGVGAETVKKLELRGDSLYAGTTGGGIFVLDLKNSTQWQHFSNGLYWSYSYTINSLNNLNGRLFTGAGISAFWYINENASNMWDEYKLENYNSMVFYDFAARDNYIFSAASLGLYTSTDSGKTFTLIPHNIGGILFASMALNNNDIYMAFTKNQISYWFKSDDNGLTLKRIEDAPNIFILSAAIIGDILFAGRTDGLWYRDLNTTDVDDEILPAEFVLNQNYPNPFNPETIINFTLPKSEFVTLKIYDAIGGEVAELMNEFKPAGNYNVKFSADRFKISSGVYFYKLSAGNYSQIKKMILIK